MKKLFGLILVVGFLAWLPFTVQAAERITDFSSDITVNADGTIKVVETITVIAEHDQINHGIYRDLIADYVGADGNHYDHVNYQIISVKRNGEPQIYDTENTGSLFRVYMRDKDVLVPLGSQVYELTYQVGGLMRYFENADELYWNVTGNGWAFPIDKIQATVNLPWKFSAYPEFYSYADFYTGFAGDKGKAGAWGIDNDQIKFESARGMDSAEGMTIVVGFPKGRIAQLLPEMREVDSLTKFMNSLDAGKRRLITSFFALIALLYFALVWFFRGRDPRPGTIIPLYEAPTGLSPADIAHVIGLGASGSAVLGAAIISLAVKGKIKIAKVDKFFTIAKWQLDYINKDEKGLTEDELLLVRALFAAGDQVSLPNTDQELSLFITRGYQAYFKKKWSQVAYVENFGWLVIGTGLTLLTIASYFTLGLFVPIFVIFFSLIPILIIFSTVQAIGKTIFSGKFNIGVLISTIGIIIVLVFSAFFVGPFLTLIRPALGAVDWVASFYAYWNVLPLALLFIMNVLAIKYLRRPTVAGRKLLDEIEGFKLFLVTTEKDRLEFFHPIEQIPEVFEKYFPYAVALGVADKWTARFEKLFQERNGQTAYAPVWFTGSLAGIGGVSGLSSIGSSLGSSLSSSGSGGGGSSGGGGGGGGGGGC